VSNHPWCAETISSFGEIEPSTRRESRRYTLAHLCFFAAIWVFGSVGTLAQEPILPPLERSLGAEEKLSEALNVLVKEFRFEGNTVFSDADLVAVVSSFANRKIDSGELEDARRAVTLHYVNQGYVNSGAVLEDQSVADGIITITVVEGRLSEIEVTGNKRLRAGFIANRIRRGAGDPLNLNQLQDELLIINENPNIQRINAELKPGTGRGESVLGVIVAEKMPWNLAMQSRNDRPPSVGGEVIELLAGHQNVSGNGDALEVRYGVAQRSPGGMKLSGIDNLGANYRLPLNSFDTTLLLGYNRSDFAIVEEPFTELDIKSHSDSYSVALRQPLYKTPGREFSMTIAGDRRHSESFLLGEPFSFSPGAVDGQATVSAVRFTQEWVDRNQSRVIALRSTLSWGIDVLGSTDDGTDRDGKFVTWLGQAQYVRRLWDTANQLVLSANFQWSDDPLMTLEQLSLGGMGTVRGYRQNQMVRDLGAVGSIEFRVPIFFRKSGEPMVSLAPFFDYGNGWNQGSPTPHPRDLTSAGIGLLVTPHEKVHAQLYWGYPFRDLKPAGNRDAQDYGLHFSVWVSAF